MAEPIGSVSIPAYRRRGVGPGGGDSDDEATTTTTRSSRTVSGPPRHGVVEYQVVCRGPVRGWSVWRRYSAWVELRDHLVRVAATPVLPPLPPKAYHLAAILPAWLGGGGTAIPATSSREAAFLAARQVALEAWLRVILTSPQVAWRRSEAWRSFLALPAPSPLGQVVTLSSGIGATAVGAGASIRRGATNLYQATLGERGTIVTPVAEPINGPAAAATVLSPTASWSELHQALLSHIQAIRHMIHQSKSAVTLATSATTAAPASVSSAGAPPTTGWYSVAMEKRTIATAESLLERMQERNDQDYRAREPGSGLGIGKGEFTRRAQVWERAREDLREACRLLSATRQAISLAEGTRGGGDHRETDVREARNQLLGPSQASSRTLGAGSAAQPDSGDLGEDGATNHQLLAQQQVILQQQDEALDALSAIVARQRMLGLDIGQELERQVGLIGELEEGVEGTRTRIQGAERRLGTLRKG